MGLFDFWKKGKKKETGESGDLLGTTLPKDATDVDTEETQTPKFVLDASEQIVDAYRQIEEAKVEYQAVTNYLTDMQKIDMIPMDEREFVNDSARKIITLSKERTKFQDRKDIKISDAQYKHLQQFEEKIPGEIVKLKKSEEYYLAVKNDIRNLEGEKGTLHYQKEEILKNQRYLKWISIITSLVVLGLFCIFALIGSSTGRDMAVPYILFVALALASAGYILYSARKNEAAMKLTEMKLNKAIGLMNRVKIKYINTNNLLDYSYSKYMVNSSSELTYLWEQYMKAKDAERLYKDNTDLLNFYNEELVERLRHYQLADPDIWIYQAVAIIDNREMVEVRHRLNVRRQKLRERIEYNSRLLEEASAQKGTASMLGKEALEVLDRYAAGK